MAADDGGGAVSTQTVKAVEVESIVEEGLAAGSIKFYADAGEIAGMHFVCPCGCGDVASVTFGRGTWRWNGDRKRPTVIPSIRRLDGCQWHGFLTNGEFRECST